MQHQSLHITGGSTRLMEGKSEVSKNVGKYCCNALVSCNPDHQTPADSGILRSTSVGNTGILHFLHQSLEEYQEFTASTTPGVGVEVGLEVEVTLGVTLLFLDLFTRERSRLGGLERF